MRALGFLLVLGACVSRERREAQEVCDQYMLCATVVEGAEALDRLMPIFARDGSCWDLADAPEACRRQCADALLELWYQSEERSCDPVLAGVDEGTLTLASFRAAFERRLCDAWEACDATGERCPGAEDAFADPCAFDPAAARDCLEGAWTCNTDFPGFPFVEPPAACDAVCGPPTDTD